MPGPGHLFAANDEQKQRWLPGMVSGKFVGAIAMTEPNTGSDLGGVRSTAKRHGDSFVVNGAKTFISNGIHSDLVITVVKTDPDKGHRGISLLIAERGMKGFERGRNLDKMGIHAQDTAELFYTDVEIPKANLLGEEGMGFVYQMQQFQEERLWGAISAVVGMERLIAETAEYTRERKVFGRPLLDNQIIHFKLAELSTEVELVRSLCYRACEEYLDGKDVVMLASMAKLKAGRMVRLVTDGCLQYWGGAGYLWESPTARAFRDSRLASIGGGADEVMLQIISKLMGIAPGTANAAARKKPH